MKAQAQVKEEVITIKAPSFQTLHLEIEGTAPYMQARFSAKAMQKMMNTMAQGTVARGKKERAPRDFEDDFQAAMHRSSEGWVGIPAGAFRNAAIDCCRMVGYKMTHAKMSIFVEHDGFDAVDGDPLIRLKAGDPERVDRAVRNDNGSCDIRIRPMWREWSAILRIRFDADQFTANDVINLVSRAGMQVGIGEGRPFSKNSNGLGFGLFQVKTVAEGGLGKKKK